MKITNVEAIELRLPDKEMEDKASSAQEIKTMFSSMQAAAGIPRRLRFVLDSLSSSVFSGLKNPCSRTTWRVTVNLAGCRRFQSQQGKGRPVCTHTGSRSIAAVSISCRSIWQETVLPYQEKLPTWLNFMKGGW